MPSRRTFVLAASTALAASRVWGANDRVPLGIVGLGGRGRDHITQYLQIPEAQIVALCDVNQAALERATAQVQRGGAPAPTGYAEMRKLFEDKNVGAVSIVTPNHWHTLASIWALQAGKDVYVEKPVSHNIHEGRQITAAARKYGRIVQVGHQSRSIAHKRKAMELLQQGVIGKVYLAKGVCYKRRPSIGRTPEEPTPPGLDWSGFLGPAPLRPYSKNRFAYNWHWFWDTGNGDIGNQGVHEMDLARWGLGVGLPRSVVSTGGKFAYDDDQETPNTQHATFDYGDKQITFEVRGLVTGPEGGLPMRGNNCIGNGFYGTEGWMALDSHGFQVYKGEKSEKVMDEPHGSQSVWDTRAHMVNFLEGVRTRKREGLHCDVEVGATSAALCHLANISYRLGRKLEFDPQAMKFKSDAEANRLLTRAYREPYAVPTVG